VDGNDRAEALSLDEDDELPEERHRLAPGWDEEEDGGEYLRF
jgi:hypothetical protein